MEMERRRFVAELVVGVNDDAVADVGCDVRDGPLAVDANGWAIEESIRVSGQPRDVEIVGYGSGPRRSEQRREEQMAKHCRLFVSSKQLLCTTKLAERLGMF